MTKPPSPNKEKTGSVKEQYVTYDVPERYELIGGIRYDMKPSPALNHQVLVMELGTSMKTTCNPNGIVVVAPMDVHLDEENVVQPDVIFISNENDRIIKDGKIKGTPDLLVEILSPSSGAHDKIRKKALYEKFGVLEYWIVDPILKTVDQFLLEQDKLHLAATYGEEDRLTSPRLSCVNIELSAAFAPLKRFEKSED
ncbi:Uma2 family endonuclease [Paenibacillus hamazuiensis]|uniref:Uma2 family endonuclease n=1 Tax=Paenibacillus hamazuiensis TaxID=2936508 RepID=UPI00200F95E7|nr:Uma2 family endonuclease [Paenibacillus hamazuiensis]